MADMPHCLSGHGDKDIACNGDPDGATAWERKFCGWRNRCVAFAEHLQITGRAADHYLVQQASVDDGDGEEYFAAVKAGKNQVRFETFLDKLVKKFRVKSGKVTAKPKPPPEKKVKKKAPGKGRRFTYKARSLAKKAIKIKTAERSEATKLLAEQFRDEIARNAKGYKIAPRGEAISPGEIYSSFNPFRRYLAIYVKASQGYDKPLAKVVCKPQKVLVDIHIAVDIEAFRKAIGVKLFAKLAPERVIRGGQFLTKLKALDREKVGLTAETLGKLVNKRIIKLPEPQ